MSSNAKGNETPVTSKLTPLMLNHAAWVTHDVEATADFYTRIMGMELASTVFDDKIPSTGDPFPYFHIFFRMQDGSTIAFFEGPDVPPRPEITHPVYGLWDHFAVEASSRAEVDEWRIWLLSNDIPVVGPTDHKGLIYSIYFQDPNGLRLEITAPLDVNWNQKKEQGERDLKLWGDTKRKALEEGRSVAEALSNLISEQRKRYE